MNWTNDSNGSDDAAVEGLELSSVCEKPGYATRYPPLVQPIHVSSFTEKTLAKYTPTDLAREWVALFQTIGGASCYDRTNKHLTMKMNIADTVFLSPTGQPSVWYRTSSSKHVKMRRLATVTVRSIKQEFVQLAAKGSSVPCAVVRRGFGVDILDHEAFEIFCEEMNGACIRPHVPRVLPDDGEEIAPRDDGDNGGDDGSPQEDATDFHISRRDTNSGGAFCLQRYVPHDQNVSFISLWRHLPSSESSPAKSPRSPSKPRASSEVFLLRRQASNTMDTSSPVELTRVYLDGNGATSPQRPLADAGFDTEMAVPLLLHMKLLTAEIVSRINRASPSSRQVTGIACEFFISEVSRAGRGAREVFFDGLAGIQWQGHRATWESLCEVDAVSQAIHSSTLTHSPRRPRGSVSPTGRSRPDPIVSLELFYEMNPRFPSIHSPMVAEKQWKHKSALLPPHVSPRYMGAEMPKMFRDGQFQPLLTPHQSDVVNRLGIPLAHTQPSPLSPRHPLSKRHLDVERELWARQDAQVHGSSAPSAVFSPMLRSPGRQTQPPSPRNRYRSIVKEELV